jgi:GNAT superfamily N-acetyltransferase
MTRIRPAASNDVPVIVELVRKLASYERLECSPDEAALAAHLFSDDKRAEVLMAEREGTTAGFALFFTSYSTFLTKPGIYLEDLFVLPEHRKCGIGRALLVRLAEIAKERGSGRLEWSVLAWNQLAIDFYESLGASKVDGWQLYRLTGEALDRLSGEGTSKGISSPAR